jgi:hypothetical protein
MTDCIVRLVKVGGIWSLYKGCLVTTMRDIPSGAIYFLAYENYKKKLSQHNGEISNGNIILAGGLSGITTTFVSLPIDTVKTRYQTGI